MKPKVIDRVDVIEDDRGYLNSKSISADYNIDNLTENGFYSWVYGEGNKKPDGIGAYYIRIQKITDGYVLQELTKSWNKGKQWFRVKDNDTWSEWQEIATTTKTPFSCTASTNMTIITQSCYVLNGEFTMTMRIKKTDNSTFTQGASYAIATTPITPSVTHIASAMAKSTSNESWSVSANVFAQNSNKTIYAIATTANANEIYFTIKGGVA